MDIQPIPLVDLKLQNQKIASEVWCRFAHVINNNDFILGEATKAFERAFARFAGVQHCIGVGSGTDALELILRSIGTGPGDDVIVPVNTFIATALAVVRTGAVPVFVDCDVETLLIDVRHVAERISKRTRAVIPVHLYGQMAPMETLRCLADDAHISLLEDAAQAHGARQNSNSIGTFGEAAASSFYPSKNLGAYGDAGAVLTNDDAIAHRIRCLGNYGSDVRYQHSSLGFNSRLDTLQAVVLQAKLVYVAQWNEQRREAAKRYDVLLAGIPGLSLPVTAPDNIHVFHLYVVRVPERDRVLARLHEAGIEAGIHYPTPIHLQDAFKEFGGRPGDFPRAEQVAREILSLPLFPGITTPQQERIADELRKAVT